ncbi:pantoate--beta-alanine ligase [bacterium]|nr:pantoate--beta-alanine ligase [bacterium]
MELISTPDAAREYVLHQQVRGNRVSVVPTMGALHDGHLSLIEIAKQRSEIVLATIFVNPTQFAVGEDLGKYPRTLEQDLESLRRLGVDAVFVPEADSMYPSGFSTMVQPPTVAETLEGLFRREHFSGVCTVVLKLFHCIPCDVAVFGRKDYQQWKVIEAMVRDLNIAVEIVAGDIVRDPDGLAMSSRNRYLDTGQRQQALRIPRALDVVCQSYESGIRDASTLEQILKSQLLLEGDDLGAFRDSLKQSENGTGKGRPIVSEPCVAESLSAGVDEVDYAVIVDAESLQPIDSVSQTAVALVACRVGTTRLIDNRLLG